MGAERRFGRGGGFEQGQESGVKRKYGIREGVLGRRDVGSVPYRTLSDRCTGVAQSSLHVTSKYSSLFTTSPRLAIRHMTAS